MSLWTKIRDRVFGATDHPQTALPMLVRGNNLFDDLVATAGGLTVPNEQTALQVSAIYACVNLIAGAISAMPLHIYRQDATGERDRLPNDALWWVFNEQMVPRWSAAAGWEFLVASLLLRGDAFGEIVRDRNSAPVGLIPIHPDRVTIGVTPDGMRLVYAIEPETWATDTRRKILDQDDVLHVPGFGFDGVRGMSPLKNALRMTGTVALATQEYAARFFANQARPDYVLQSKTNIGGEAVDRLRAQIDERHRGPAASHRPLILSGGLEAKVIGLPLEDLQLLQLRQFQIEEIARVHGVPPFMIGHTEKTTSWGSGVGEMGTGFVRYALRTHLNKIENEINRKFFRTASRVAAFDTAELERADTRSLFESYRIALGRAGEPGFMTTEEVRERLNLKRKPDGTLNLGTPNAPPPAAAEG